jgi:hypothetical protein
MVDMMRSRSTKDISQVDLGELGLAVGAGVLVAEAADDLQVAVAAGDHQDLFEQLGALRQGVPHAGLEPGGHEEVAGALGGGPAEHGRLDLEEAVGVEVVAGDLGDAVADAEDVLHARAAEVEVAEGQAGLLAGHVLFVRGDEGELGGLGEQLDGGDDDLDLAGGDLGVGLLTLADGALDRDAVLVAEAGAEFGGGVGRGALLEDDLGEARTVSHIDEDEALAVAAVGVDPAVEGDGLTGVLGAELAAGEGALHHGTVCLLSG